MFIMQFELVAGYIVIASGYLTPSPQPEPPLTFFPILRMHQKKRVNLQRTKYNVNRTQ